MFLWYRRLRPDGQTTFYTCCCYCGRLLLQQRQPRHGTIASGAHDLFRQRSRTTLANHYPKSNGTTEGHCQRPGQRKQSPRQNYHLLKNGSQRCGTTLYRSQEMAPPGRRRQRPSTSDFPEPAKHPTSGKATHFNSKIDERDPIGLFIHPLIRIGAAIDKSLNIQQ